MMKRALNKVLGGGGDKKVARGPAEVVSYGILLYKRGGGDATSTISNEKTKTTSNDNDNDTAADSNTPDRKQQQQQPDDDVQKDDNDDDIRFLLGLIPQRNWWTVFKGLPQTNNEGVVMETPHETALREFQEETSIALTTTRSVIGGGVLHPELTLQGQVGSGKKKKRLVIYLIKDGDDDDDCCRNSISTDQFDVSKVVPIDNGYMKGQPEIVAIQWLSYRQAMDGILMDSKHAKIYTSQRGILEDAYKYLTQSSSSTSSGK